MRKNLAVLMLTLALCASSPAFAGEVLVSAAASLTDAFTQVKAAFEKARPGSEVVLNFAASGALLAQMAQGAPVDVFAAADQETMDKARAKNLIDPASRTNFAENALVLAAPAGNPAKVAGLDSLDGAAVVRVAAGNPDTVPAGRYAKAALGARWEALAPKLVLAESVRQVLDYLSRGEVEAGFVYATDAKKAGDKVTVTAEIPLEKPVSYPVAVANGCKDKPLAEAFVAFLKSPDGAAILAQYGFKPAKP